MIVRFADQYCPPRAWSETLGKTSRRMPIEDSRDAAPPPASWKAGPTFAVLACGITWIATIPEALRRFYLIDFQVPQWAYILCLFGPAIAAVIVALAFEGTDGLRRLAATFRFRVSPRWYGFALFVPLVTLGVVAVGMVMAGAPWPSRTAWWMAFSQTFWLLPLFLREELGWRGYLLPLLLRSQTPLRATAWTTLVWTMWHVPQYVANASIEYALLMIVAIVPISGLFTLLYIRTRSVIPCVLFHSAIDCGSAQLLFFPPGLDYIPALAAWAVLLWLFAFPAMRAMLAAKERRAQPATCHLRP